MPTYAQEDKEVQSMNHSWIDSASKGTSRSEDVLELLFVLACLDIR